MSAVSSVCAEGQLTADELAKVTPLPMAAAQQGVRVRQRIDAAIEHLEELVRRTAAFPETVAPPAATQASTFFTRWSSSAISRFF